jgi:hypothetical protein
MIKGEPLPIVGNLTFILGSLGWAIDQSFASAEYRDNWAEGTKVYAKRILDRVKACNGAGLLRDLTPEVH